MQKLDLSGCKISDNGVRILVENLVNLKTLNFSGCNNITDTGLLYIAERKKQPLLGHAKYLSPIQLNFSGCNNITEKGIYYLTKCKGLVTYLNISNCKGIKNIDNLSELELLQSLNISSNEIPDLTNVSNLIKNLPHLKYLDISNCQNIKKNDLINYLQKLGYDCIKNLHIKE
ncbi:hypothetical protein SD28_00650 [Allofrancisella guangzhouensis]|uniref:Leucine-rich repeat protein n=1 Tax=Allofrancisella guangzhouensis TaxID=594679 RepID=A0A0A8E2U2_9GAMM|nr:leucine-rich repeat domain-containing protein [Allofrancisella guangzhouensis]AJC48274.1 hypothetical protein SD28_00650 [Allofrancisella guangzhouensis]MBK2045627.1 hypothetical protein [Allofrancisella guangzhouensis]